MATAAIDIAYSEEGQQLRDIIAAAEAPGPAYTQQRRRRGDSLVAAIYDHSWQPGWDGYDATAIELRACLMAADLFALIPAEVAEPDIIPEADGDIALEWQRAPRQVFSISISATGRIAYAGLFGSSRVYGTEQFTGTLPLAILEGLRRLWPGNMAARL
jgi:hypothetical protein